MERLAFAILMICAVELQVSLPDPIAKIVKSRQAHTAEWKWSLTREGEAGTSHDEYVTRVAPGDLWQHGAKPKNTTVPPPFTSGQPYGENALVTEGIAWYMPNAGHPLFAYAIPLDEPQRYLPFDFSLAGIAPAWEVANETPLGLRSEWIAGLEAAEVSGVASGPLTHVVAAMGDRRLEWTLDAYQGGQPTEAAFYMNDRLVRRSTTSYRKIDGRWVPKDTEFYYLDSADPAVAIHVDSAGFDQADHVQDVTPEDIGLRFGTSLTAWHGRSRWGGTHIIEENEYEEMVYLYGVEPVPLIVEALARESNQTLDECREWFEIARERYRQAHVQRTGEAPWLVERWKERDEWDVYVEKFITEHKLDELRAKRANELLERCKRLRDFYRRKNIREIREAQREGDAEKLAHYEKLTTRIFETVLVPGLKRLVPAR